MGLVETISEQIKTAMKSGEKLRLETLRSVRAGIIEFEKSGIGREITEEDCLKIISQGVKKRKDSIEQFTNAGRMDLADKEKAELEILLEFMPQQMTEDEVKSVLQTIIAETGANGAGDFAKVMGAAMKQLRGKADGSVIQSLAKSLLS